MKRTLAFLTFALFYIVSFAVGTLFSYFTKDYITNIYLNLFLADVIATVLIYFSSLIAKNASTYDAYWSLQSLWLITLAYLVFKVPFHPLHLITIIPFLLWAIRLTVNWLITFKGFDWEDFRYRDIKTDHPRIAQLLVFVGIMLIPTCLVYLGTMPLLHLIQLSEINLITSILGGVIVLSGTILEMVSDIQKMKFKGTALPNQLCEVGLWKFSRHPNYLGEIMIWVGLFISSVNVFWWPNIFGFALIIFLFLFISIPMMEKHILKSRPQFAEYKQRVSMLLVLPQRKPKNETK